MDTRVQETRFDSDEQASVASLLVLGDTPLSPRLSLRAGVGYDRIRFSAPAAALASDLLNGSEVEDDDISGERYAVGIRWQPDRRLEFNAEYAERSFGRQPAVSLLIKGRRSQVEFRWSRDLQINQFVDTSLQQVTAGEGGNDINQPQEIGGGGTIGLNTPANCDITESLDCPTSPFIANARTIEESIEAIYTLRGRVSTLMFSLEKTELTDLSGENSRDNNALELSFTRALARNVTATLTGRLSETQTEVENATSSDFSSVTASLVWLSR